MGKSLTGKELGKGISQRKDGRYQARFVNRFGVRQTVYGTTIKEIKNALHQEKISDIREENTIDPNMTVNEWFNKWCDTYKEPYIKETTMTKNKSIYKNRIMPVLGKKKVSEVSSFDITYLISIWSRKYTKGYIRNIRGILYDMFECAYSNDLCQKNPVRGTKCIGKPNNKIEALSIKDQKDFFSVCKDSFYYNAYVVQINTGMRVGELTGLCINDIDFENNIIHIQHSLILIRKDSKRPSYYKLSTPKTKCSIRDIPMNDLCKKAIINQMELRKRSKLPDEFKDLLFFAPRGYSPLSQPMYYRSISKYIDIINEEREKTNQPLIKQFGTHTFRHTFATRCFEAGIPPKTVQHILGHASIQMTMDIYTSVMEDKRQEDIKKLNDVMNLLCS